MKEIKLTKGYSTLVDDEDFESLSKHRWHAIEKDTGVYAANEKKTYMHRFLLSVSDSKVRVDHRDGNGLNNRRYNLRIATHAQNGRNQKKHKDNQSGYKGVNWESKAWRARIVVNRKSIHLGRYTNALEAAKAYDVAAVKYHGEFASLNFPQEKTP